MIPIIILIVGTIAFGLVFSACAIASDNLWRKR